MKVLSLLFLVLLAFAVSATESELEEDAVASSTSSSDSSEFESDNDSSSEEESDRSSDEEAFDSDTEEEEDSSSDDESDSDEDEDSYSIDFKGPCTYRVSHNGQSPAELAKLFSQGDSGRAIRVANRLPVMDTENINPAYTRARRITILRGQLMTPIWAGAVIHIPYCCYAYVTRDNVGSLAQNYGSSAAMIAKANRWPSYNSINYAIGQLIYVPSQRHCGNPTWNAKLHQQSGTVYRKTPNSISAYTMGQPLRSGGSSYRSQSQKKKNSRYEEGMKKALDQSYYQKARYGGNK